MPLRAKRSVEMKLWALLVLAVLQSPVAEGATLLRHSSVPRRSVSSPDLLQEREPPATPPPPPPTQPPPESLVPDFPSGRWNWAPNSDGLKSLTPQDLVVVSAGPGPAPGPAPGFAAAPAPSAMASPAPGPAPVMANVCGALFDAGEKSMPGQFMECQEFRYYSRGPLVTPPFGCHCSTWSVSCPFETCGARRAWEENCLAPEASSLGFTSLSKTWHPLPANSLPQQMKTFKTHPGIVSMCMYWLPKPATPTLPPLAVPDHLPEYGNLHMPGAMHGQGVLNCLNMTSTPMAVQQTKAALQTALGESGIVVVSVYCGLGAFNALLKGPNDQVARAISKAAQPQFCFKASEVPLEFCTPLAPGPSPSPAMSPGPAPGAAPAPAPKKK